MKGRPLGQVEVEEMLMEEVDHLEALTNGGPSRKTGAELIGYDKVCEIAADAEVDYKLAFAQGMIGQAGRTGPSGRAERRDIQEARVLRTHAEDYRNYKRAAAAKDATKEALATSRARADAIRTIAANIRAQV